MMKRDSAATGGHAGSSEPALQARRFPWEYQLRFAHAFPMGISAPEVSALAFAA